MCVGSRHREYETTSRVAAQHCCHLIKGKILDVNVVYGVDEIVLLQQPAGFCCTTRSKSQNLVRPGPAVAARHAYAQRAVWTSMQNEVMRPSLHLLRRHASGRIRFLPR